MVAFSFFTKGFMLPLLLIVGFMDMQQVDVGLASVYHDKVFACPKSTYKQTGLPTVAHRTFPCGTIINVKRIDVDGEIIRAVVADRGPFGACIPSKKSTRACGHGSKWINGGRLFRQKNIVKSINWRGILDMSGPLAKLLGVKNRLVPVVIYTDLANNQPFSVIPDNYDDPKLERKSNVFDILTALETNSFNEPTTETGEINN